MKTVKRRIFTSIIACFMACMMFAMPVLASTTSSSYFSKTTTKLNAVNGGQSSISSVTSGSVPDGAYVTSIKVFCNVARGTDPYTLYIKSPEGTIASYSGPMSSTTFTTHDFDGENPKGTWKVWIVNSGVSYNGNIIPTSTVTVSLTVYYDY